MTTLEAIILAFILIEGAELLAVIFIVRNIRKQVDEIAPLAKATMQKYESSGDKLLNIVDNVDQNVAEAMVKVNDILDNPGKLFTSSLKELGTDEEAQVALVGLIRGAALHMWDAIFGPKIDEAGEIVAGDVIDAIPQEAVAGAIIDGVAEKAMGNVPKELQPLAHAVIRRVKGDVMAPRQSKTSGYTGGNDGF